MLVPADARSVPERLATSPPTAFYGGGHALKPPRTQAGLSSSARAAACSSGSVAAASASYVSIRTRPARRATRGPSVVVAGPRCARVGGRHRPRTGYRAIETQLVADHDLRRGERTTQVGQRLEDELLNPGSSSAIAFLLSPSLRGVGPPGFGIAERSARSRPDARPLAACRGAW